jgi:hypothetical protein
MAHEPSSEKAGNAPLKLEFIKLEEGSQSDIPHYLNVVNAYQG